MRAVFLAIFIFQIINHNGYAQEAYDYGDAPSKYGIAAHKIDSRNYLGSRVDAEDGSLFSTRADGDDNDGNDDEDGVVFTPLSKGEEANIEISIRGEGYLNVWFDWNGDGDFMDNDERAVSNSRRSHNFTLEVKVPENPVSSGPVIVRVRFGPRLSWWESITGSGTSDFGEVEDYAVYIGCGLPPDSPDVSSVVHPTCSLPTGSIVLSGLPSQGNWVLTRYPGGVTTSGSGTTRTIQGLQPGQYSFTVTNLNGCVSAFSPEINVNQAPPRPQPPLISSVTDPTCAMPSGSVSLTGLPSGNWTINPGAVTGSATSATLRNLNPGNYYFTVTNVSGCTSAPSSVVVIPQVRSDVTLHISDPSPVCSPHTVNLTVDSVTEGSTPGITYTYWRNPAATTPLENPFNTTSGTYYIKGTSEASKCWDIEPVSVQIISWPVVNAGEDQELDYEFETTISADPPDSNQQGVWSVLLGGAKVLELESASTTVIDLSVGPNILKWTVTNKICPAVSDSILIFVKDIVIPSLITPNMDGRNDYFVLDKLEVLGRSQLTVFDRRGITVYIDNDYDNSWYGLDLNEHPLPEETYFYILRSANGKHASGFIVIKR